jgi:uncharacterized damage-inducible protein DinB
MTSLTAEQATFICRAIALPVAKNEHAVTKSVIAAIPADKVDYRPNDVVRSAIDLAWHIAVSDVRFIQAVANGVFEFSGGTRPEAIRTPAEVNDWYTEHFAQATDALKQTDGDRLTKIVDFRGILQFPAVMYLQIGMSHVIHHRGQLSMYLRPMGARVPSIYGESFDAREAREKAQGAKA